MYNKAIQLRVPMNRDAFFCPSLSQLPPEKQEFKIAIDDDSYRAWTAAFTEGSENKELRTQKLTLTNLKLNQTIIFVTHDNRCSHLTVI